MKFYIEKLGCPKNDVDADYIAARLIADGHLPVAVAADADSVIVNTCGFIQAAKEESIEEILRLAQLKKTGGLRKLFAAGCLSQRYGDEMLQEMPELDGAFGHGALNSIARAMNGVKSKREVVRIEPRKLGYLSWKDRYISDGYPYSYLKISDGCDRKCTYCAIPSMRGRFRSRSISSIVNEAAFLAEHGKKELILVSQEATIYGIDKSGRSDIIELLKELEQIDDVAWIRLMYLYPAKLDRSLVEYMLSDNKTLPYFDLPLQHVNTDMLKRMRRPSHADMLGRLVSMVRSGSAHSTLRTTFIVGFPGETDEAFDELKDAVIEHRFDRMGVFTYSAEEGTPAAKMPDQIDADLMESRREELMTLQSEIAFENNSDLIGSTVTVLIDRIEQDGTAFGRTASDCPDIDQEVIVSGGGVKVGDLCQVKIESALGYDLAGECVMGETVDSV